MKAGPSRNEPGDPTDHQQHAGSQQNVDETGVRHDHKLQRPPDAQKEETSDEFDHRPGEAGFSGISAQRHIAAARRQAS